MQRVVRYEDHISFYRPDPHVGWWGRAGVDQVYEGCERRVRVVHNRAGNRDWEYPDSPDMDGTRVVCLGGSMTWGYGVEASERFTDLLPGLVPGAQCFNFAHCNIGLDQAYLTLKHKAGIWRPDVVVLEQHPWVVYRVLLRTLHGYLKPYFWLDQAGKLRFQKLSALSRLPGFSGVVSQCRAYVKEVFDAANGVRVGGGYDPMMDPLFMPWKMEAYDYLYRLVGELLREIRDYCRLQGYRLVVLVTSIRQQFEERPRTGYIDYDLPGRRLVELLDEHRVPYLDLCPALMAAHAEGEPVVQSDGHWSAAGHAVAAQELAGWFQHANKEFLCASS